MKKIVFLSALLVASMSVQAKTVSSTSEGISPAKVDQIIRLVDKRDPGSSHKKVSVVVEDHGMSTDVSPRYTVYLGYASLAEMGNFSVNFKINDQAFQFVSASRKAPGIYEVKVVEYREEGLVEVTQEIDAVKMFADEQKLRNECGDFCDQPLRSSVTVKETLKKLN